MRRIIVIFVLLFVTNVVYSINVFVSVLPLKYFVSEIGGKAVKVRVMVNPGQSPETYEPTPFKMRELGRATIYYRVGVPFEAAWLPKIHALYPRLDIVDLRHGIALKRDHDPHIWNSPLLVLKMARTIRNSLIKHDPERALYYQLHYLKFISKIKKLDQYIRNKLKNLKNRVFLVYHPAWGYFADSYNLKQLAIENAGKMPGPKDLRHILQEAKNNKIKIIFVQPEFSTKTAKALAAMLKAKLVPLDPLAEDYVTNMHKVVEALLKK